MSCAWRQMLRQWGAQLAILVGAYVSLGTSCDSVVREAELSGHTRLPSGTLQRQLQLSVASDGALRQVLVQVTPRLDVAVDVSALTGNLALVHVVDDTTHLVDCNLASCDEIFLTLTRAGSADALEVSVEVKVLAEGDCGGSSPEFIEIDLTEVADG